MRYIVIQSAVGYRRPTGATSVAHRYCEGECRDWDIDEFHNLAGFPPTATHHPPSPEFLDIIVTVRQRRGRIVRYPLLCFRTSSPRVHIVREWYGETHASRVVKSALRAYMFPFSSFHISKLGRFDFMSVGLSSPWPFSSFFFSILRDALLRRWEFKF